MRWVTQTRFGGPDAPPEERGNCYAACIASLVGVPLESMSRIAESSEDQWDAVARSCVREAGYSLLDLHATGRGCDEFWARSPGMLVIATGKSPRGDWHHCVVWRIGEGLVHDPHPSREGLSGDPEYFTVLVPLDPAEACAVWWCLGKSFGEECSCPACAPVTPWGAPAIDAAEGSNA